MEPNCAHPERLSNAVGQMLMHQCKVRTETCYRLLTQDLNQLCSNKQHIWKFDLLFLDAMLVILMIALFLFRRLGWLRRGFELSLLRFFRLLHLSRVRALFVELLHV